MTPQRGSAPVGYVTELDPVESRAVLYLRLWCDGPGSQAKVWNEMATQLGPKRGRAALKAFERLCNLCVQHGRRPLVRHHVACKCVGADESCFANFIGYASEGQQEDALLIATTIVRPDMAPSLVRLAQEFGLALRQMSSTPKHRISKPSRLH
ncbi:MAG: hypothetical protein AAGA78_02965 [Pseudomonadota bacterium]